MDVVKALHWLALFLAVLGPLLGGPGVFNMVLLTMFVLGLVAAIATYESGVKVEGLTLLLIVALAMLILPSTSGPRAIIEYLNGVIVLGAWYILPIALVQGWKALIS